MMYTTALSVKLPVSYMKSILIFFKFLLTIIPALGTILTLTVNQTYVSTQNLFHLSHVYLYVTKLSQKKHKRVHVHRTQKKNILPEK